MRSPLRLRFALIFAVCFLASFPLSGAEQKSIEFQGRVSGVDVAAKTISVRTRTKEFVFQVDTERCKITKDGVDAPQPDSQSPALASAKQDDYVVGILALDGPSPVVTRLYLTTQPEVGVRVESKHGHIASPYRSENETAAEAKTIDVRGYQRGSMLVDKETGKIFLVP
jgi:hypothetical protein